MPLVWCLFFFWGDFFGWSCEALNAKGNHATNISFGTYYNLDIYRNKKHAKRILVSREDSSYVSIWLDSLADTIGIAKGTYSIFMPKGGKRVDREAYNFLLSPQKERTKVVWEDSHWTRLDEFVDAKKFHWEMDSVLLDVQVEDSCFTLTSIELDDGYCRDYYYSSGVNIFCANAAYRDSVLSVPSPVPEDSLE